MLLRALPVFIVVVICFAIAGCKNEPFETAPLGVLSLADHSAVPITLTFRYHDKKLYTFMSRTPTDTLASMKFIFQHEELQSIISDSTKTSFKKTFLYEYSDNTVDSTFLFNADTTILVSSRTVIYDGDRNPIRVRVQTWTDEVATDSLAEITWDAGNVVHLTTSDLLTGEKVMVKDMTIAHDDQYCVYMKRPEFLYTLYLSNLYWLSQNNPVTFSGGASEKSYIYWYNKLGYPSNFQSDTGVTYGVAYTQIR